MYKDVICDNDRRKWGRDWDIWSKILYNIEIDALNSQLEERLAEWQFHTNNNHKRAGVAVLISNKISDFRTKIVSRDKGYFIMIKGSTLQSDTRVINTYAFNNRTDISSQYWWEK